VMNPELRVPERRPVASSGRRGIEGVGESIVVLISKGGLFSGAMRTIQVPFTRPVV